MSVQEAIKKLYDAARINYRSMQYRRESKRTIRKQAKQIPPLTDEERRQIKEFWAEYGVKPDYNAFRYFYFVSGIRDPHYITSDLYVKRILYRQNDLNKAITMSDKNLLDLLIGKEYTPHTLLHNVNGCFLDANYNLITEEQAASICRREKCVVVKPSIDSGKGKGVACVETENIESIFAKHKTDFVIQNKIEQHSALSALNASSVNVIRITTMLLDGNVTALSPCVRVGDPGCFVDQGGEEVCIGILPDGRMREFGVSKTGKHVKQLPNGYIFGGKPIPCFSEIRKTAIVLHSRFAFSGLIGWDFTVDANNRIVVIEANLKYPGIVKYQECNGPLFGDDSDELISRLLKQSNVGK